MEDSLEHYIQITRNTKEGRQNKDETIKISKTALITLQKKKECEARAFKIVQFLIEGKLHPQVFLRCLKHINQAYYQDVVEERAISKLCGYSLCDNEIPNMPKQKYFIDTKNNKVYDVTDRKNYCSNFCYKASVHIKNQIDNGPLWLRKLEDSPKFYLLPSTDRGSPGEEISQGIAKPVEEPHFMSVAEFTDVSLSEVKEMEVKNFKKKRRTQENTMETVKETSEIESNEEINESNEMNESKIQLPTKKDNEVAENTQRDTTLVSSKKNPRNSNEPHKNKSSAKASTETFDTIRKYIREWITIETYIFLYGENKMKALVTNSSKLQEYFKNLKKVEAAKLQQKRYLEICRKLQLTQLAENKFDREVTHDEVLMPVPDYRQLKIESKNMDLKIHSFYSGTSYELEENIEENSVKEEQEKPIQAEGSTTREEENNPAVMPLVDSNSQAVLRRKVYLNSISKAVINITQNLGIPSSYVLEEIRLLVKTFQFEAHNVVLKPSVFNLVALILLKMLSIRDNNLRNELETEKSNTFIRILLSRISKADSFLVELFQEIENVNLFLERYLFNSSN